jgi:pyroglutamyl-peptidase
MYDVVIQLGLHVKIDDFALERVGLNIDDYRIPDNRGERGRDRLIYPDGQNAHFVTLPVRSIEDSLIEIGVPCHVSYSAGTYLCNHLLYTTLNHIASNGLDTRAGFIHIPPFEMMEKETMEQGLLSVIRAILRHPP